MKELLKDLLVKFKADVVKVHKSMTVWFNGIVGSLIIALPFAQNQFPQLQPYLPEWLYHHAMAILVTGNIILRFKTNKALSQK